MEKKKKLLAIRLNKLNYAFFEKIRNFLYEKDVIDVDIPFDQSNINDLVIETDKHNIEISTNKIIESL